MSLQFLILVYLKGKVDQSMGKDGSNWTVIMDILVLLLVKISLLNGWWKVIIKLLLQIIKLIVLFTLIQKAFLEMQNMYG